MKTDIIKWQNEVHSVWPSIEFIDMKITSDGTSIGVKYVFFEYEDYIPFHVDVNKFLNEFRRRLIIHIENKIKYLEMATKTHKETLERLKA